MPDTIRFTFLIIVLELNPFLADEQRQKLKHHAAERKPRQSDVDCEPRESSQMGCQQRWAKRYLSLFLAKVDAV